MVSPERLSKGLYWDQSLNLVTGCTHVSYECRSCWLESESWARANHPNKKISEPVRGTVADGRWTGHVRFIKDRLEIPRRTRKPTVYAIWSDLFHPKMPYYDIYEAYVMMAECKRHRFIVCTKRPERIRLFFVNYEILPQYLPNVLHMTTAGTQEAVDTRIPALMEINTNHPEGNRWPLGLSAEPLLEEIDLSNIGGDKWRHGGFHALYGKQWLYLGPDESGHAMFDLEENPSMPKLDFVIAGCEQGKGRRHTDIEWFRSLRDQCASAGVPFFLKQADIGGTIIKLPALDGVRHDALPGILAGNARQI